MSGELQSNYTAIKSGNDQSESGLPRTGPLAFAHSAAYIASICPDCDEFSPGLKNALCRMRLAASDAILAVEAERAAQFQKNCATSVDGNVSTV